jgi:predicted metal-dependent hydrolase
VNRAEAIPGQLTFEGTAEGPIASGAAPQTPAPGPAASGPASTSPDASTWSPAPAPRGALVVEVVRSSRRRKTAQARLHGSRLEIRIPAGCSRAEEAELVKHFRAKFERMRGAEDVDLVGRAAELAGTYGLPLPSSIRWVGNQHHRWGSCTPADGSIRLSDRMTGFPPWVVDYVIVHELAHLVVASHSARFWGLVNTYPLTERARGFLMAKGWEED